MYLYYFLQFRLPKSHVHLRPPSYLLFTDADIMFRPRDVRALINVLIRCGWVISVRGWLDSDFALSLFLPAQ